jgi:hypothetical protein
VGRERPVDRGNRSVAIVFEKKWLRGKRVRPLGGIGGGLFEEKWWGREKVGWRLEEGLFEKKWLREDR